MSKSLKFAIFVGGSGTRMWPMSRKASPKQFQTLVGQKTMFQQMIDHLLSTYQPEDIFISTSPSYTATVLEQAPMLKADHIITEPELRDTTAAVGYAAIHIAQRFPGSMMATIWGGDHLVRHGQAFTDSLQLAHKLAEEQNLTVQVNVRPTYPTNNLGYIEIGKPIYAEYGPNIHQFVRQVEKPDLATAKKFLASVNYLWHTGYRIWDVNTLLDLYQQHVPEAYQALMAIQQAIGTEQEQSVTATEYAKIIKKSIDYTIFEHVKSDGQAVIAADLGWNDIGTWEILKDELSHDTADNIIQGQVQLRDTVGSLVYGQPNKIVAVIGLENMIVVDTPDALLVMPKDRAADVKKVVEQLKEDGLDQYV